MFKNSTIIVTWAGDWLWKALTKRLHWLWAIVIWVSKTQSKLDQLQNELSERFFPFQCNLSQKDQLNNVYDTILKQFPVIDILVNNAAIRYEWPIWNHDLDTLQSLVMTNIFWVMWSVYKILPGMKEHRRGQILNINSTAWIDICKDRSPYAWTKFAITGYTKWLYEECAEYGIKVMQFHPWWMNTNIFETFKEWYGNHDWMMDKEKIVDILIVMLSQSNDMVIDSVVVRKIGKI